VKHGTNLFQILELRGETETERNNMSDSFQRLGQQQRKVFLSVEKIYIYSDDPRVTSERETFEEAYKVVYLTTERCVNRLRITWRQPVTMS